MPSSSLAIRTMTTYKLYSYVLTILSILCIPDISGKADEIYLEPEQFLTEVFSTAKPEAKILWITKDLKSVTSKIMTHSKGPRRVRYWAQDRRTAWILEEIGKVKPITTGIIINDGRIERIAVLIYRESRGWEVRHSFFTDQFVGAHLIKNYELSESIDGISGATLSVSALTRLAQLSLYLHEQTKPR